MSAKFPARPPHQATTARAAAPPANEISCDEVVNAFRSLPRGAAPGPKGMRPDFLKQVVDAGDEQYGAQVLTDQGVKNQKSPPNFLHAPCLPNALETIEHSI